ncbi:hypothetical protein [Cellulomonas soli]
MVIGRRREGGEALARAVDADIARPFLGVRWSKDPVRPAMPRTSP